MIWFAWKHGSQSSKKEVCSFTSTRVSGQWLGCVVLVTHLASHCAILRPNYVSALAITEREGRMELRRRKRRTHHPGGKDGGA